jgi:hypothetical protein
VTSPLELSFAVDCPADHAFSVWTTRIGLWWPHDHTMSGDPDTVVIEGHVGGRIFERARDGVEHEWGVVTDWDPPHALTFTWHLGRAADDATEVAVRFVSDDDAHTHVTIEHRGWERLADAGDVHERTRDNWSYVVGHFADLATGKGAT